MTDLPLSISHLTDPLQLFTLVVCACTIVLFQAVRVANKSSALTPAHRYRLLSAAVLGAIGLSLGACIIVGTGAGRVYSMPTQKNAKAPASSLPHRTEGKPTTVVTEHRVVIPEAGPTPVKASAQQLDGLHRTEVRPSFDCARATLPDELTICADLSLRRADGALGRVYQSALATVAPASRSLLVQSQKAWIVDRRRQCGTDPRCFFDAIQLRSHQLE